MGRLNSIYIFIDNLMPADVCYGREETVLGQKDRIKLNPIAFWRKNHHCFQPTHIWRAKPSLRSSSVT